MCKDFIFFDDICLEIFYSHYVKEDNMDILSATSKQAQAQSAPVKVESTATVRSVETTHETAKTAKEQNEQSAEEIKKQLNDTVEKLNRNMEALDTNIKFGFNDKISMMFVNVMERSTGKLIRKIPSEEAMSLSEKMQEIIGTIFDKKG
ncbi:MAG: flagellar protein FlaG [Sulfurospirillum sp.]|jgi:flagellar protein FlaG|nr:flagellar protein FlaG [Sulfurospirillum sp.]